MRLVEYKRGQFKINGIDSEETNSYIRERPKRIAAERVIDLRERPGNDSIVIDHNYYRNSEMSLSCYAKAPSFEEIPFLEQQIGFWLDMGQYSDFIVYFDPHYIYQAIVTSPPEYTGTRKNGLLIPYKFSISLRPFKMARLGLQWQDKKIYINPERYPSKPKISLSGSGDIVLWINEQKYEISNLDGELIIDSMLEESYRETGSGIVTLDNKTKFKDFPVLPIGEVSIKLEGNATNFKMQPRWWTKI